MQAFTTSHKDPLTAAAAGILFSEDVSTIEKKVKTLKVGDKTNFGIVKAIGDTWISFKGKDLGVTKIAFNQRKMGSKDYVLDQLRGMNEEVNEGKNLDTFYKMGAATNFSKKEVDNLYKEMLKAMKGDEMYARDLVNDLLNARARTMKVDLRKAMNEDGELEEGVAEKMMKLKVGDKTNFGIVKEITSSSISFKNASSGATKIPFGATKVKHATTGATGFVLDDLKLEGAELEEGISFDAIAKAGKLGMSDAKIDSFVRIHKANGRTDKEINAMLLSGKGLKEDVELDEASAILQHSAIQKATNALNSLELVLTPNSNLAKLVIAELGDGYAADFKKMDKWLAEIIAVWDDIRKDLSMG